MENNQYMRGFLKAVVIGACLGSIALGLLFIIGFDRGLYLVSLPILVASQLTSSVWLISLACIVYFSLLGVAVYLCLSVGKADSNKKEVARLSFGIGLIVLVGLHIASQRILIERLDKGVGYLLEEFRKENSGNMSRVR